MTTPDTDTPSSPLYPTLHHLESSMSLRILCALEELRATPSLNFNYRLKIYPRSYNSQGTKEVHPLGKSPVLCIGPKPEEALTEARLVLQYLADTYSRGLWEPESEEEKRRDVFFQEFANASLLVKVDFLLITSLPSTLYPFGLRHLASLLFYPFTRHFRNDLHLYYQYMEDHLSDAQPWFSGKRHGLADFNMIFPMDMAVQRGYFDQGDGKYPRLVEWLGRIHGLEGYRAALEKGGKYDLKNF